MQFTYLACATIMGMSFSLNVRVQPLELTCTGLHALRPFVANFPAACTSAVLVPTTTGSAATDSPRFLEGTALVTTHHIINHRGGD